MRKRSYFRWITDTENQKTNEKGNRHQQRRELEGGTGGQAGCQRMR